jgi:hypothetical protein
MFANLISHALSHAPGSGRVGVTAAKKGGYLGWWSIIPATLGFAVIPWFMWGD